MATSADRGSATKELLLLRVEVARGNPEFCPRFENPQSGNLQAEVLLIGLFYELIEDRIVETFPPFSVILGLRQ